MNQLGSRDEAEDAVQTTFLNAHRALQRGVTPEAELPWLFKIAHNVCLTRRRSARRRTRVESPSDLHAVQDVLPAPARDSSDELMRLNDALEDMPSSQRHAILLREWRGLSYHEIAAELKVSQSAVETLIFRARRTLASKLRVEAGQPTPLARMRKALDAGALLTALKTLFEGGAAAKVAAVAVVASGTALAVSVPQHRMPDKPRVQKTVVAPKVHPQAKAVTPIRHHAAKRHAPEVKATKIAPKAVSVASATKPAAVRPTPAARESSTTLVASATAETAQTNTPPGQAKTPPGQLKKENAEPEHAEGRDKPKPKDVEAAPPQKPAEPPKAQPDLRVAAEEHGPPADPGNPETGGPKK